MMFIVMLIFTIFLYARRDNFIPASHFIEADPELLQFFSGLSEILNNGNLNTNTINNEEKGHGKNNDNKNGCKSEFSSHVVTTDKLNGHLFPHEPKVKNQSLQSNLEGDDRTNAEANNFAELNPNVNPCKNMSSNNQTDGNDMVNNQYNNLNTTQYQNEINDWGPWQKGPQYNFPQDISNYSPKDQINWNEGAYKDPVVATQDIPVNSIDSYDYGPRKTLSFEGLTSNGTFGNTNINQSAPSNIDLSNYDIKRNTNSNQQSGNDPIISQAEIPSNYVDAAEYNAGTSNPYQYLGTRGRADPGSSIKTGQLSNFSNDTPNYPVSNITESNIKDNSNLIATGNIPRSNITVPTDYSNPQTNNVNPKLQSSTSDPRLAYMQSDTRDIGNKVNDSKQGQNDKDKENLDNKKGKSKKSKGTSRSTNQMRKKSSGSIPQVFYPLILVMTITYLLH